MGAWNQMHDEVREHTLPSVNRRIDERVEEVVADILKRDDHALVTRRICELEDGWDAERTFGALAGTLVLAGTAGAARWRGAWWLVPAAAGVLLLEQAMTGGSMLMRLMRRVAGLRTRREMDLEKFALKGLRGDFTRIPHEGGPELRANAALVAAQSC